MTQLKCLKGKLTASNDRNAVIEADSLGSCLALCFLDKAKGVSAVGVILFPGMPDNDEDAEGYPMLYAGNGLSLLYKKWSELGGERQNLQVYIAGCAQFMEEPPDLANGTLVYKAVRRLLGRNKIPVAGEHVGGPVNRTLIVDNKKGQVKVVWGQEREKIL